MKSIYELKPAFQDLLRPICNLLAQKGVTANQITISSVFLSFIVGGLLYWQPTGKWPLFLVPIFLFIRMALNAIDGILAREHNLKSNLGTILNECGDVLSDAALYLPFSVIPGAPSQLIIIIVILSIISEMLGVIAIQIGASRRYDGPMGKSDRAFAFGLIALLLGCGLLKNSWLTPAFFLIFLLLIITIFNRANNALKEVL